MAIPSALAAELRLLDQVLGGSPADIATTLMRLMSEAGLAVSTYLGLAIRVSRDGDGPLELTTFEDDSVPDEVGTSVRFTLGGDGAAGGGRLPTIDLVLFAARPGAFVDLAADLGWLTGRPARDFHIDDDLVDAQERVRTTLASWSVVNQAKGALMSDGLTLAEADLELDARAATAGIGRHLAAADLLATIRPRDEPGSLDATGQTT